LGGVDGRKLALFGRASEERSVCAEPSNKALKLTKRDTLEGGALRAPSSLRRASQLSAVFDGRIDRPLEHRDELWQ
jgi:hypothetical protein